MKEIMIMLEGLNVLSVFVRMLLAMFLGGVLGVEREHYKRAAGFRTFVIVCVGSTLTTMTGIFMYEEGLSMEAARIPAQIISGMGFLGAGTILVTRNKKVKGLTTAASLWTAACIGIAVGSGFYAGAIIGTLMIAVSLEVLKHAEKWIRANSKECQIYVEISSRTALRQIVKYSRSESIEAYEFEVSTEDLDGKKLYVVVYEAKKKNKKNIQDWEAYIEKISEIENVVYAEVM